MTFNTRTRDGWDEDGSCSAYEQRITLRRAEPVTTHEENAMYAAEEYVRAMTDLKGAEDGRREAEKTVEAARRNVAEATKNIVAFVGSAQPVKFWKVGDSLVEARWTETYATAQATLYELQPSR